MPRAKVQRETHIVLIKDKPTALIDSTDPAFHRRMAKLKLTRQGDRYTVPREWIQVRPPRKLRLTEAERERRRVSLVQNLRSHSEKRDTRTAA